jgi:hypothetical protein
MNFLDRPPHPNGIQAELSQFLAEYRDRNHNPLSEPAQAPVGEGLTKKMRETLSKTRRRGKRPSSR